MYFLIFYGFETISYLFLRECKQGQRERNSISEVGVMPTAVSPM